MTVENVEERVLKNVRRALPKRLAKTSIGVDQNLRDDLGLDSIVLVSIAFLLEEEFGVDVTSKSEELSQLRTIRQLSQFIQGLTS